MDKGLGGEEERVRRERKSKSEALIIVDLPNSK